MSEPAIDRGLRTVPRAPDLVPRHRRSQGGEEARWSILHGGPGASHDYADRMKLIAHQGRAVIHYDQLGCGKSTHLKDKGVDFWTVQLFLDELDSLLDHLGIRGAYHVLGQSWGGMLGAEHAVTQPKGLKSLTISDSPASMELWVQEANKLRDCAAARCAENIAGARGGRHHDLEGIHDGDDGVLRAPCLPRAADAGGSPPQLRPDRGGPDRLLHHERARPSSMSSAA